jgi:hypothetical protein
MKRDVRQLATATSVSTLSHLRPPSCAFNGKLSAMSPGAARDVEQLRQLRFRIDSSTGAYGLRYDTPYFPDILPLVRPCLSDQRTWIQPIVSSARNYLLDLRLKGRRPCTSDLLLACITDPCDT